MKQSSEMGEEEEIKIELESKDVGDTKNSIEIDQKSNVFGEIEKQENRTIEENNLCPITFFTTIKSVDRIVKEICQNVDDESLRSWAETTRDARRFISNLDRVDIEERLRRKVFCDGPNCLASRYAYSQRKHFLLLPKNDTYWANPFF